MRRALVTVGILIAAALGWRALQGPYQVWRIRVNSPLTLESAFVVIAGVLLALDSRGRSAHCARGSTRSGLWACAAVIIAVAAAFSPDLRDPFISDDYVLTQASLDPHRIASLFHTAGGDGAYRPAGYIWYALIHSAAGENPFVWHICSLAVHIANCILLYAVVRGLWPAAQTPALIASLLFGLHGTRPEVIAWTSDQFDGLACFFILLAACCLFCFNKHTAARIALALLLALIAIFCKESAYAAPVVIAGLAAAAGRMRERPLRLFILGSLIVCIAMFAFRWTLFHGPGGYADPVTGRPAILSLHFVPVVKALGLRIWTILLFPVNWDSPGGIWLSCAILSSCAAVLLALSNRTGIGRRSAAVLLAATALAVVPAIHLALIGQSALGSRILYLPAIGFFVLLGHLTASRPLAAALLLFGALAMLEHNLSFWHRTALAADRICSSVAAGNAAAATSPEARAMLPGMLSFGNGLPECVSLKQAK